MLANFERKSDIEKGAEFLNKSTWTNKTLQKNLEDYKQTLKDFLDRKIKPSKIIGTGYKPNRARPLAEQWLKDQIAKTKMALELRGESFKVGGELKIKKKEEMNNIYLRDYRGEKYSDLSKYNPSKEVIGDLVVNNNPYNFINKNGDRNKIGSITFMTKDGRFTLKISEMRASEGKPEFDISAWENVSRERAMERFNMSSSSSIINNASGILFASGIDELNEKVKSVVKDIKKYSTYKSYANGGMCVRNGKEHYEKADEGMYEGGEVRVLEFKDNHYIIAYLNEDGTISLQEPLQSISADKFEKAFAYIPKMAKGGMMPMDEIPDLKEEVKAGRVTYRGMGFGKDGTKIKVKGKEYVISDEDFNKISRDENGELKIRFAAPSRHEHGGYMEKGGEMYLPVSKKVSESEIEQFVDYVDSFYGENGIYANDYHGGFSKKQIKEAIQRYFKELKSNRTWGNGDTLDREIVREILIKKYEHGGYMSAGIENQYIGKSAADVWDEWTIKQRHHFLLDHEDVVGEENVYKLNVDVTFNSLSEKIKEAILEHVSNGEYEHGGEISVGDYKTLDQSDIDFYKEWVDKLNKDNGLMTMRQVVLQTAMADEKEGSEKGKELARLKRTLVKKISDKEFGMYREDGGSVSDSDECQILYYAVYDENVLGLLFIDTSGNKRLLILHASVLKGSTHGDLEAPLYIDPADKSTIRRATEKDFEDFRVSIPPDFYQYKHGGSVKRVRFQDKVDAIAESLEGEKVPAKYKKQYGAFYSADDADEAARRIAGSKYWEELKGRKKKVK